MARRNWRNLFSTLPLAFWLAHSPAAAEVSTLRIAKQPGLTYLQLVLIEDGKLIEKHASALGLADFKTEWVFLVSGGATTDALLAGSLDIAATGVTNLLLLWGKTNGEVKAIAGVGGLNLRLVSRNPRIKTVKDFVPADKIAVPTVRVSLQAVALAIALDKAYGSAPGAFEKLLPNEVQLGHPDAMAAILNPVGEIDSAFNAPPYQDLMLKTPGVHTVVDSEDVLGGPAHGTLAFLTRKFHDANPTVMKALLAAFDEAERMIKADPEAAARTYIAMTKEKIALADAVSLIKGKDGVFKAAPVRTEVYANAMAKFGYIKTKPASWKDYFFSDLHEREGS